MLSRDEREFVRDLEDGGQTLPIKDVATTAGQPGLLAVPAPQCEGGLKVGERPGGLGSGALLCTGLVPIASYTLIDKGLKTVPVFRPQSDVL
jgi:hypothetical protein